PPLPTARTSTLSLHDALPICSTGKDSDALRFGHRRLDRVDVVEGALHGRLNPVPSQEGADLPRDPEVGVEADDPFPLEVSRHDPDRKSTRLNSSHVKSSYAVF